jgi:peptidyl-tRNA hydrolase
MTPAMYIFLNKGLGMSTGKSAAQAAHAAVEAYRVSPDDNLKRMWYCGGHYMKLVMGCRDREHLLDTERYLNERGFKTALIVDEGHTEVDPITPTALGVQIVDKDDVHVAATFESFRLYKDPKPAPPKRWWQR